MPLVALSIIIFIPCKKGVSSKEVKVITSYIAPTSSKAIGATKKKLQTAIAKASRVAKAKIVTPSTPPLTTRSIARTDSRSQLL